jgi:cytochrome c oxidase subunit IV
MSSGTGAETSYKGYWITWGIMLVITAIMLAADSMPWSKYAVVGLLLAALLIKVSLIGGEFMHLRFEKPILIWTVAVCILFFSAFLFILIAFDGIRIARMLRP